MTPEQRTILDRLAEACYGPRTFNKSERDALRAALCYLDARLEDNGSLIDSLRRALADLDACRKALAPLAHALAIQAGDDPDQWPHRFPCVVWLTQASADAVLTAAGEAPVACQTCAGKGRLWAALQAWDCGESPEICPDCDGSGVAAAGEEQT